MSTLDARGRVAKVGLAALLLLVVIAALWRFAVIVPDGNTDDAFILLVYARHFAATGALYYNVGDGPLDGFTSPLDLFIKSAAIRLFPTDPIFDIWILTLALYLAVTVTAIYFAWTWTAPTSPRRARLIVLGGLLVATSNSLADGAQFLLETPLYVLIGMWLCGRFILDRPPTSFWERLVFALLLSALPLSRPEGLIVSSACLLCFLLEQRRRLSLIELLLPPLVFTLTMAIYYRWRIHYFGTWAPNSYYAKTSASRLNELRDGLGYVLAYALSLGLPTVSWLLASPLFLRHLPSGDRRRYGMACLLALAALSAVIFAGGDCYRGGRFLALPITLGMLTLFRVLGQEPQPGRRPLAHYFLWAMLGLQCAELVVVPGYLALFDRPLLRQTLADQWPLTVRSFYCDVEIAARLSQLAAGREVAQTDYQRLKYFADKLRVLDLTGLNNRAIAHREVAGPVRWGKFSFEQTLALRPPIWILGHHVEPTAQAMAKLPLSRIFADPQRSEEYFGYPMEKPWSAPVAATYTSASLPVCGGYFNFCLRRDLAAEFQAKGVLVGPIE